MHPAIILDKDQDIIQPEHFDPRQPPFENIIYVIGVSTKHKQYAFEHVSLPFAASGHTLTKLRTDCGAIIGWYDRLSIPDDITGSNGGFGGDVPVAVMDKIEDAVRRDLASRLGKQFETLQKMFQELLGDDA